MSKMSERWKARYQELQTQVAVLRQEKRSGRAAEIIRLRETNPCATLQVIGNKVNLSRERVRQMLHRAGLPTKHIKRPSPQFQCLNCGVIFTPRPLTSRVKRALYDHESFCTKKCATQYHVLTLICETCGTTFQRPQSRLMDTIKHGYGNHIFCSRTCYGKWLGKTFGFPVNHAYLHRKQHRKYNYEQVLALREKTGWGCCRLSRALGIPESAITYILAKAKAEKVLVDFIPKV